jgi:hypothetical protein
MRKSQLKFKGNQLTQVYTYSTTQTTQEVLEMEWGYNQNNYEIAKC